MSVQSEIDRIITAVGNAYSKVSEKGGTVPASQTVANLATAIDSIPSGSSVETGTLTSTKIMSAPGLYNYTFDLSPITNMNDRSVIILISQGSYIPGSMAAGVDCLAFFVRLNKSDKFCMYMGGGLEECTTFSMGASWIKLIDAYIINSSLETPAYIAI